MLHPDDLDMRIMRELEAPSSFRWNIRESYASIAKTLGVDEDTVARRVERVRQAGILRGWELVVNPHILGMESASIELDVAEGQSKRSAVEKLKLINGMVSILNFSGRHIQAGFYYRSQLGLERQVALMESICGGKGSMLWKVDFPPFLPRMTPTDWEILDHLRSNPRAKLQDLAREAGVSTRTLNRRIGRMVEGYAFFLHAAINLEKLGGLACRLIVRAEASKKRTVDDEIIRRLDRVEWLFTVSDEYSMFVVHCENTAEAEGVLEWVKVVPGVRESRLDIVEGQITVSGWLDEEIEARKSALGR